MPKSVLLVECQDTRGLVHAITGALLEHGLNITQNQEFVDRQSNRFFMRTEVEGSDIDQTLVGKLRSALPQGALVRVGNHQPKKVVLMVSREPHCLGDLLIRHEFQHLNMKIMGVFSNHQNLRGLVEKFHVPFFYVPHERVAREEHEKQLMDLMNVIDPDYVVLAKYMRILSAEFAEKYFARMINIHHSFLPAFVGAKPYQQAFDRGVKVIGATAHFVTKDLDEGPIIVQQVIPVDHSHDAQEMAQAGKDVEQVVLSKALKLLLEDRIFLSGNRTIIFE